LIESSPSSGQFLQVTMFLQVTTFVGSRQFSQSDFGRANIPDRNVEVRHRAKERPIWPQRRSCRPMPTQTGGIADG
jgi:hypothetical protein